MRKHHSKNELMKHQYAAFLEEATFRATSGFVCQIERSTAATSTVVISFTG